MVRIDPFLRWAGGKRWLAKSLSPLLSDRLQKGGTYFEPFLGSGAMFFAVQPKKAVLSDLNRDLITTFKQVALHPDIIINRLSKMLSTRSEYEFIRDWRPTSKLDQAVRFIYLNRNCYGGLYRENKYGIFNVPYGGGERNHRKICSDGRILLASSILNNPDIELNRLDFGKTLKRVGDGDVIYCDPTYREITRRQFDRYGKVIFRWEDQERLAQLSLEAFKQGAVVIISNTTSNGIRKLYPQAGVVEIKRRKGLGPSSQTQKLVEYVLVLDPYQEWSIWEKLGYLQKPKVKLASNLRSYRSLSYHISSEIQY